MPSERETPDLEAIAEAVTSGLGVFLHTKGTVSGDVQREVIANALRLVPTAPAPEQGEREDALRHAVKLLDEAEDELSEGAGGHEILGAELGMLRIRLERLLAAAPVPGAGTVTEVSAVLIDTDYEGSRLAGLFSTPERAEAFALECRDAKVRDGAHVEKFSLDRNTLAFLVRVDANGRATDWMSAAPYEADFDATATLVTGKWDDGTVAQAWGRTKEDARVRAHAVYTAALAEETTG